MSISNNILIVCSSGYGSTTEVALRIAEHLKESGWSVDVRGPTETTDLDRYGAVIIGSPIRYDRWMPAAKAFVVNNQEKLQGVPVAYFFCCLTLAVRDTNTENKAQRYADDLRRLAQRDHHGH